MKNFEMREIKVICINGEWYEFSSLVVANFLGEQCSELFTRIWRANQRPKFGVQSYEFQRKFSEAVQCDYYQFEPIISHLAAWRPETVEKMLAAAEDGRIILDADVREDLLKLLPALQESEKNRRL